MSHSDIEIELQNSIEHAKSILDDPESLDEGSFRLGFLQGRQSGLEFKARV